MDAMQETTREEGQRGNSASISAATGISDIGQVLQQKTFTRSKIERLKALLHSNPYCSPSSLLRLEASTSGSLKKHGDERDNLHAITTPMVTSRVLEEEIASPVELAKAYMGSRPSKGITSSYGREEALTSSQSAFQHGGKMALKRRSSILDDDIGSGGPLRRIRQKANLLMIRDKREPGYTALQQPDHASHKLLLMNESEPKIVKGAKKNRDTSMHGSGLVSGYANIPTKSTQTATKILQHLEKMDLKEKNSGSTKSPTKLTLDMLHGQALRSLEKVDSPKLLSYPHDNQKSEVQHHERLHDSRELTSKGKEKVEENGPRKFPIKFRFL
ncbi:hypothetical protein Tco_0807722 [Tanacetum coccineum]